MAAAPKPASKPARASAQRGPMDIAHHRSSATSLAPAGAYRETLMVRSYEAGPGDRVRPATVLRFLEHLATRASATLGFDHHWYAARDSAWVVREMSLLLGSAARMDQKLTCATWVSSYRKVQAFREYVICCAQTGRLVARAQARWAYISRSSGQLQRVPAVLMAASGTMPPAMRPRSVPPRPLAAAPLAATALTARTYEADTQLHVNNAVYADWLDEAQQAALLAATEEAHAHLPRYYRLEYVRPARPGNSLLVNTWVASPASRALTVWQEITQAATDLVMLRATSAHLRSSARRVTSVAS